jgi:AraC-like DNA-binding protein
MITNFNPNEMDLPLSFEEQGSSSLQPIGKHFSEQLSVQLSEIGTFFNQVAAPAAHPIRVSHSENEPLLLSGEGYVLLNEICAKLWHYSVQIQHCRPDVYLSFKTLNGLKHLSLHLKDPEVSNITEGQVFKLNSEDKCIWYQLVSVEPYPLELKQLLRAILPHRGQVWVSDHPKFIEVLLPLSAIGATESYEPSVFMKSLLHSIDLQFTNGHFGIDQLAESLHISRAQLFRKVKGELQIAPHDFLFEMRMEAAWVLVTRTDLHIGKIYNMIGFASDSYFHQAFKRHYGVHPNAIRKAIQESL